MREAQYIIVQDDHLKEKPLVIKDIGPWNRHLTVTNDAENVVQRLERQGHLPVSRRLFYYDSEGELSEILVRDGFFAGFALYRDEKASPAATNEAMKEYP